jgi:hypothetical protein
LSAIILCIGRLASWIYDDAAYRPIPNDAHAEHCDIEEYEEELDEEDTELILTDIVNNQSIERLDYFTGIKR